MNSIHVSQMEKVFRVPEREPGLAAALKSLVNRQYRDVHAVDKISFDIAEGEIVGFLGSNGAGKTTILKMLSGLLHPTGGEISVLGHTPSQRKPAYLKQISLVMGNRNQLQWDIPAADSFELNRAIYQVPEASFQATKDELVELLEVGDLIKKPVRNLSLGERMKVEILGALLHLPKVLFLDEPTLGLDVGMQRRLREFVLAYNVKHGATVLLTSHYMADIEALCQRVIIVDKGHIHYDGALSTLSQRVATYKELVVTLQDPNVDLSAYGTVISKLDHVTTIRMSKPDTAKITAAILAEHEVLDFTVEDPPIEDIIELVFAEGAQR